MTNLLDHLRPETLAQIIAELLADHADEDCATGYDFHTEAAAAAYSDVLTTGRRRCGEDKFHQLVDLMVGRQDSQEN